MKPQVYHVDAFTSQPFRGNSAGVVFPADNLSEAQMQLIARELGQSFGNCFSAAQRRQRCAHPLLYANR